MRKAAIKQVQNDARISYAEREQVRTSKASAKVIKKGESIYVMYYIYVKKVLKNTNSVLRYVECVLNLLFLR